MEAVSARDPFPCTMTSLRGHVTFSSSGLEFETNGIPFFYENLIDSVDMPSIEGSIAAVVNAYPDQNCATSKRNYRLYKLGHAAL